MPHNVMPDIVLRGFLAQRFERAGIEECVCRITQGVSFASTGYIVKEYNKVLQAFGADIEVVGCKEAIVSGVDVYAGALVTDEDAPPSILRTRALLAVVREGSYECATTLFQVDGEAVDISNSKEAS